MLRIFYQLIRSGRPRELPALVRDLGASVVVLLALAAAAALPLVTVPAAALVLLPVLLLTAVAFGRDSALLAALLAALAARFSPLDLGEGSSAGLLRIVVLVGAALAVAALWEELRRSQAEAESAHLRSDVTARRAAERVEAARWRLSKAEARLAEAERAHRRATAAARTGSPDPALESAFRSEGGV